MKSAAFHVKSPDFMKSATKDLQLPGMVRPMFFLLTGKTCLIKLRYTGKEGDDTGCFKTDSVCMNKDD